MLDGGKDVLFFDGGCGLCRRSVALLRALDWFGRLGVCDLREAGEGLPVTMEEAMRGIPMRTRDGRVLVGMPAVRRALCQTVMGCAPGALMYVPGISQVARWVYGAIAARRAREACGVG